MDFNWFQLGPIPSNVITGHYDYPLVILSYIVAVLASFVALDLAGRLQAETKTLIKTYWLLGGGFAMGAGIWSMHFIGMLAFIMPMHMSYDFFWTSISIVAAILASILALYLLRKRQQPLRDLLIGGIIIGLGIATMHYMGMTGMTDHVNIRYIPSIFFLSIAIAIVAAEAALWLAFRSNVGTQKQQFNLKVVSALVMGIAICGMHYTGMYAAVFTPLPHVSPMETGVNPTVLAILVALVTTSIISIALVASTYYRRMKAGIQNEKDFLNIMLNNLSDEIIACNLQGIITVCNNVFSHSSRNLLNKPYKALNNELQFKEMNGESINQDEHPLYLALHGEYLKDKPYLLTLSNANITKDVLVDGQPILNSDGEKLGAVVVIHDITALKHTEKLKKEFVSIVSHELRTPLTSIKGALSLLLGGTVGNLTEGMAKLLKIASNNSERLIRLINDILDIEKIEAGKMEFHFAKIDIRDAINDAIIDVQILKENANINIIFDDGPKTIVNADKDRLIQVIINLLSNAIKFSAAGQTITIKLICYVDTVRVSVIDQGPGIPKEFQNFIFQKFSQADTSISRAKGGTGLGLSICKAIIEKHGGIINFESTEGKGTCFYFELPIIDTEAKKIEVNKKANVLICDSNPDSAEIIRSFLSDQGIVADVALTAAKAWQYLKTQNYDLLTMDMVLQDQNGIKFIREIRDNPKTKNLPIVVITTYLSEGKEIVNSLGFQIIDWIQKPFKKEQLYILLEYINLQFPNTMPRVLSVEDDADLSTILKVLLKEVAELDCAGTLEEAQNLLRKNPYDLIVLDIKLPDGLGTDLLPCINCKTREVIPVIVFSAYELDKKYAHLVRQALLKSTISTERLFAILRSILLKKV